MQRLSLLNLKTIVCHEKHSPCRINVMWRTCDLNWLRKSVFANRQLSSEQRNPNSSVKWRELEPSQGCTRGADPVEGPDLNCLQAIHAKRRKSGTGPLFRGRGACHTGSAREESAEWIAFSQLPRSITTLSKWLVFWQGSVFPVLQRHDSGKKAHTDSQLMGKCARSEEKVSFAFVPFPHKTIEKGTAKIVPLRGLMSPNLLSFISCYLPRDQVPSTGTDHPTVVLCLSVIVICVVVHLAQALWPLTSHMSRQHFGTSELQRNLKEGGRGLSSTSRKEGEKNPPTCLLPNGVWLQFKWPLDTTEISSNNDPLPPKGDVAELYNSSRRPEIRLLFCFTHYSNCSTHNTPVWFVSKLKFDPR